MIATADSDMTTVSPGFRNGPACSRITVGMSSPGISTGVRIGTRSNVRPSTTTARGVGSAMGIVPMVPVRSVCSVVAGPHRPPYARDPMSAPSRTAMLARLTVVAAGLALLATLAVRPVLGPAGARAMGPLPACRYDDILTTPRGYADWSVTLVDTMAPVDVDAAQMAAYAAQA